ncbi:TIGR03032 family protein [Yoonia sp. SS1-5]|uniref:TIGR03032 family protein n=1 Tax=Yoonia rhodophyticola TaxID=3137370 RepID=A0AAN0M9G9_9RHOB
MSDSKTNIAEFDLRAPTSKDVERRTIGLTPSSGFKKWLAENKLSIAFNTYNVGKLFMVGVNDMEQLQFCDATFPRAMGISLHGDTLWMASHNQVWRFENFLGAGQSAQGNDAVFVPMGATTTGMVNLHDVRVSHEGVFFVSCNFNCIGKLHEKWSFEPVWKPPFIDGLEYGDRCHLNCLALHRGHPKYATCFAQTNTVNGWRDLPRDQATGLVIDVQTDQIICDGLHMPHSPQMHRDTLYLANSGRGEFGSVDVETGTYKTICEVPGFTRGVSFWKNFAIVGSSKPRRAGVFEGNDATPLNRRLADAGEDPLCQVSIIDLDRGVRVHHLTIDGPASEIYDVCALPGIRRPLVLDPENDLVNTTFRPSRFNI